MASSHSPSIDVISSVTTTCHLRPGQEEIEIVLTQIIALCRLIQNTSLVARAGRVYEREGGEEGGGEGSEMD